MDLIDINLKLARLFGRHTVYDKPIYRVIRSTDCVEKKMETFEDYSPAGIYLGTKNELRIKPKYWYLHDCYILEKLVEANSEESREFFDAPYSYEALFPFLNQDNKEVPLAWKPIEILLGNMNAGHEQKTPGDLYRDSQERLAAEKRKVRDQLEADDPIDPLKFDKMVVVGKHAKVEVN